MFSFTASPVSIFKTLPVSGAISISSLCIYPKIDGVRLRCDASIAFYLYEHQKSKKFKIERQDDGSLIITLKPAFQHDVVRWVLGEGGKIEVLEPPELRAKVAAAGKRVWERNRGSAGDAVDF